MKKFFQSAFKNEQTRGRRDLAILDFPGVNPFVQDAVKIINSQAFQRERLKTQVIYPPGNFYSTRMSHSLDGGTGGVFVADCLGLNKDLLWAMLLVHDIGHVPFGIFGQKFLREKLEEDFGHEKFGAFVVQEIEPLNLSYEVLAFIQAHRRGKKELASDDNSSPCTKLGQIMDKVSIICNDPWELSYAGALEFRLPAEDRALGKSKPERWHNCLTAICQESLEQGAVSFQYSQIAQNFRAVKEFMYDKVYHRMDEIREQTLRPPLEKIYHILLSYDFPSRKAILTIALMTEAEIMQVIGDHEKSEIRTAYDFFHGVYPVSSLLPVIEEKYQLDFLTPDLSWAEK